MYLTISRFDICFTVHKLSQYMQAPRTPHLNAVHHLLQYLQSAPAQGFFPPTNNSLNLIAYVDAYWGSCVDKLKTVYVTYQISNFVVHVAKLLFFLIFLWIKYPNLFYSKFLLLLKTHQSKYQIFSSSNLISSYKILQVL